ncbi:MAG: hypothetical protein WDN72_01805 [Alphaproteobacteria bacterium]
MLYRRNHSAEGTRLETVDPASLHYDGHRRHMVVFPGGAVYMTMSKLYMATLDFTPGHEKRQAQLQRRLDGQIAGTIKCIEQSIAPLGPDSEPPVDIFLYTHDTPRIFETMQRHYAGKLSESKSFPKRFGDPIFERLLFSEGESLNTLSKEELKERVRSVTFVGHSMGSVLCQEAVDCLTRALKSYGWKDADIAEVTHELVSVTVASVARQDMPEPNATQFFFTAPNDLVAARAVAKAGCADACGYGRLAPGDAGRPIEVAPHRYQIRAPMQSEVKWIDARTGQERSIKNDSAEPSMDMVEHDYRAFLYGEPKEVGEHLRNILYNAAKREVGIGGHMDLLQRKRPSPPERQTGPREL